MSAKKSGFRSSTLDPHPLFEGDRGLYYEDRKWRADIPKAGGNGSSRAARAPLNWKQRQTR